MGEPARGHLDLVLLDAVRRGPAHGYEVVQRVAAGSGGAFDLAEGTVYPALHRLERAGLLDSRWDQSTGRRRRVYEITDAGQRALEAERSAWHRFANGMQLLLGGGA